MGKTVKGQQVESQKFVYFSTFDLLTFDLAL